MNTNAIAQAICYSLGQLNVRYDYNQEKQVIILGTKVECKLKNLQYFIQINDEDFIVYALCPMNADEESKNEILRYLAMANYGLFNGNFEMDVRDGEIRYKCYVDCREMNSIPDIVVARAIILPVTMFERFGDGLAALLMGFSDADTEYRKAQMKE